MAVITDPIEDYYELGELLGEYAWFYYFIFVFFFVSPWPADEGSRRGLLGWAGNQSGGGVIGRGSWVVASLYCGYAELCSMRRRNWAGALVPVVICGRPQTERSQARLVPASSISLVGDVSALGPGDLSNSV